MTSIREQTEETISPPCVSDLSPHTLSDLKARPQWVFWKYVKTAEREKPFKVPFSVRTLREASTKDPSTWATFAEILASPHCSKFDGVGFVFTKNDPYVGIDLDDCRDPGTGELNDQAKYIVARMDSYTEITPSRRGLHILVMGNLPHDVHRNDNLHVEVYERGQYFTMSFNHLAGTPDMIFDRQDLLGPFQRRYFNVPTMAPVPVRPREGSQEVVGRLTDSQVIDKIKNDPQGYYWWNGGLDIGEQGKPDHSLTDFRLLKLIRFYVGNDSQKITDVFRQSGLMRPDHHGKSIETYLANAIKKVVAQNREVYTGRKG